MKKTVLLTGLILTLSAFGSAPRGILNVEIRSALSIKNFSAAKGVKSTGRQIAGARKDQAYSLALKYPDTLDGTWKKVSFSFVPPADGKYTLSIGTVFNGKNNVHPYLHVDKVGSQGTELKNPGFELLDKNGTPSGWKGAKNASGNKKAFEGNFYGRVNFPSPLSQEFSAVKGVKVTFSFHVRQESPLPYDRGADGMTNIYTDSDGASSVLISSGRLTLIPTFENCSYYINRIRAEWGKNCTAKVWYRQKGTQKWISVLDPVNMERKKAWRGSIMLLKEDTQYEFKAVISGECKAEIRREFRTGNSNFRIGKTIVLDSSNFKNHLNRIVSGKPDAYTLYKAAPGFVLKGKNKYRGGVIECLKARYVIFDGLTIDANGARHGILLSRCENMVIRNCDISNFGLFENVRDMKQRGRFTYKGKWMNYDAGIMVNGGKNQLIERCYIHNPYSTANAWFYSHPAGPTAICADRVKGGTVIRYNDFVGTDERRWNDTVESIGNGSIDGGFGRDSDIYGNLFAYSNDDSIELEGGEMNIRLYYNRFQGSMSGVSTGSCRLGPSYQYRNAYYKLSDENNYKGSCFKNSHGTQGDGALFIINNSVYAPDNFGGFNGFHTQPPAAEPVLKMFARNNVIITRGTIILDRGIKEWNSDLDNDLFHSKDPKIGVNGRAMAKFMEQEKNAIFADPQFVDPENGDLRLKKTSPARNRAAAVPGLPVKHLGAFQDDGIRIPHRPFPVFLDRNEVNFVYGKNTEPVKITMKAGGKGFDSTFKVCCNDTFFTVTPAQGRIKSGESITFTVKLNTGAVKTARLHNGMAVIRFADGFSRHAGVYADFRNDRVLAQANRKNLIFVKDLKYAQGVYKGSITVPEKGCYFLFADLPLAYLRPVPVTASFGKVQNADHARFSTVKPGLGLLYTGSKSGWFFFLDKGTWPFTLKISGTPFKAENIFITSKPEEILR